MVHLCSEVYSLSKVSIISEQDQPSFTTRISRWE